MRTDEKTTRAFRVPPIFKLPFRRRNGVAEGIEEASGVAEGIEEASGRE
jgi:hypothetical protein